MATAWNADWTDAPRDGTQILVRNSEWDCPAVMYYVDGADADGEPYWCFSEEVIAEVEGGLIDTDGCEWALMPE